MFDATLTHPDPEGPLRAVAAMGIVTATLVLTAAAVAITYAWMWLRFALLYLLFLLLGGVAPTLPSDLEPPPVQFAQLELEELDEDLAPQMLVDEGLREPSELIGEAPTAVDPDAAALAQRAEEAAERRILRVIGTTSTLGNDRQEGTLLAILGTTGDSGLASVFESGDLAVLEDLSGTNTGQGGMPDSLGGLASTGGAGGIGMAGIGTGGGGTGGRGLAERVYRETSDHLADGETIRCRVRIRPTESRREDRIHVHDCLRKHHEEVRGHVQRRGLDARARTFTLELRAASDTDR